MTTLTKTQYQLIWVGSNMGWAGTIQALFPSETKAWDYLSQKVLEGWVVLETNLNEINQCDLNHNKTFRHALVRLVNVGGLGYNNTITKRKAHKMGNLIEMICQRCIGETNTSTRIEDLCEHHFFEWAAEKTYNDFDRSTEGLYL